MKKLMLLSISVILSLVLTGCDRKQAVTGQGPQQTQTRALHSFNHLQVNGRYDITIVHGEPSQIIISAPKNVLPYIMTQVVGNILTVKTKKGFFIATKTPPQITITTNKIKGIHLSGANQVKANNLNTNTMTVTTAGDADVVLSGKAKRFYLRTAGTANITANQLKAENTVLRITGEGNIKVYASGDLHAKITGAAKVHYYGNPRVVKPQLVGAASLGKG
jgi:hypothetical protein